MSGRFFLTKDKFKYLLIQFYNEMAPLKHNHLEITKQIYLYLVQNIL